MIIKMYIPTTHNGYVAHFINNKFAFAFMVNGRIGVFHRNAHEIMYATS